MLSAGNTSSARCAMSAGQGYPSVSMLLLIFASMTADAGWLVDSLFTCSIAARRGNAIGPGFSKDSMRSFKTQP